MGNWNRRYMPRRKPRHYDYEDPPPTSPISYSSGLAHNRVPSWEIDYCHSCKVPWNKVLASKKYIYSYPSVLNWDGSAGKEALENAKQRFWAKINGLICDNPLPDPDMYISEIDWNPDIDRELMEDLDRQVFNPDEAEKIEQLDTINEEVECTQTQHDNNQYTSDSQWERDQVIGTGNVKEGNGWGRWADSLNLTNDNPWEQSCRKLVGSSNYNAWGSRNESWNWPQGLDNTRSSSFADHGCGKPWNCNEKTVDVREDGWGKGQRERNSWSQGPANNYSTGVTSFENNNSIGSKEIGWRGNRNVSWGVRDSDYHDNETKHWDPNFRRGRWSSGGGGRKRESSVQHMSKYKSSKYLGDAYGYGDFQELG
ncbi:bifunctional endo-1,4-beta-xylanase XylA-like [Salvia splendens]|nr:bifunctional endo-1,4-beta-xylanase XylA-like [Salvia splendens]